MRTELLKTIVRAAVPRPVRNWLRSPSRSVGWIWDAAGFYIGLTKTLPLLPEWHVVCHPRFYRVVQQSQIADPEQATEFHNFVRHCSKAMFLFDIGAHFGVFSLTAAHFGGKSLAVDPSPTATRMIATEAALNGCTNNIQILRAAVSDSNGAVGMLSSGVFSDGYFKFAKGRADRELTQTQALTIDQIVLQYGSPTHIKIDVEGHEAAVLRGARATLVESSPVLFLELHNELAAAEGIDPRSALSELDRVGYAAFALTGNRISHEDILRRPIERVLAARNQVVAGA
jgi:FkbM family methyltransferase